jgi:adenylate kinase
VKILLLGPQGSGKGTQAKRIAGDVGVPHIATGDILRQAMADGTELGLRVKPIYDTGQLVPDELMVDLIRERLEDEDGFVLDGFPRTLAQAEALDAMLSAIGKSLDLVLLLSVSDEVATERMLGRAAEEGRADDTPEAIAKRLALYHEMTEPVVEHYRTHGDLVQVEGERSVEQVEAEIQDILDEVAARELR